MRFRFGLEKDFHTNMEYRKYLTSVHFVWKCPACGVTINEYHVEGCPIERTDEDEVVYNLQTPSVPDEMNRCTVLNKEV